MYIFKNAWINITRNKGRNLLIALIIIVIAISCTITLAIKNTAASLINSYTSSYETTATITFDRSNMKKNFEPSNSESREQMKDAFSNMDEISIGDIKKYADSNYVKSYYYTYGISLNSNIDAVNNSDQGNMQKGNMREADDAGDFTLTGYSSVDSLNEFIDGSYKIVEIEENAWDLMFDGNYCMINSDLADENKLKLGDKIKLIDPNDKKISLEFKIVGIYESKDEEQTVFSKESNTIITNAEAVKQIVKKDNKLKSLITPTFIITSYDDAEKLKEEMYAKGMSEYYTLQTNEEEANSATSSISNVSNFATTFLIIVLIIGAITLFIINQINIRERKYEIGVLRTIGMKKTKLTLQYVIELLIIAVISLIIGSAIGAITSKPVGNMLLKNEITQSESQAQDVSNNFGGGMKPNNINGVRNVQAYYSLNAVVNIKVLLELFIIGIILTLISSISSTISIQKFSPLNILKERS